MLSQIPHRIVDGEGTRSRPTMGGWMWSAAKSAEEFQLRSDALTSLGGNLETPESPSRRSSPLNASIPTAYILDSHPAPD